MISDEMVDAYNLAYSAVWKASAPISQGDAVTVERDAVRAGLEAALTLARPLADQFTDEFAPYLAGQLRDPEVKAAYDAERREHDEVIQFGHPRWGL